MSDGFDKIEQYVEWKRFLTEGDKMHAFKAIQIMDAIKFSITTIPTKPERLAAIEEEASKWV